MAEIIFNRIQGKLEHAEGNEWLETDGMGGYACGTTSGERSRRYHGLLVHASTPPLGRIVLLNGFEVWVIDGTKRYALSTQRYSPDTVYPDGNTRIVQFTSFPCPTWLFQLENGWKIRQEVVISKELGATIVRWELLGEHSAQLMARPLISGRDHHSLHHENAQFNFEAIMKKHRVQWKPYHNIAAITALSNADYQADPVWYRNFLYTKECERGYDHIEDLASPGIFKWDLSKEAAVILLKADTTDEPAIQCTDDSFMYIQNSFSREIARRKEYEFSLSHSADAYVVKRNQGKSIIAGYPWFGDWGRDTFIALRGLCIATGQLETAREILVTWISQLSEGMMPNCFPEDNRETLYNSVDASLWFIIAAYELSLAARKAGWSESRIQEMGFEQAIDTILTSYQSGTRYGIKMDSDGLLTCGSESTSLTWMDARVGESPVTPRNGKPVEIQALWLNALGIGSEYSPKWVPLMKQGVDSFHQRFWNSAQSCLYDVIDVNNEHGCVDPTIRPNQIFAIGGLPIPIMSGEKAQQILSVVEEQLLTPIGLRSLDIEHLNYCPSYKGNPDERDEAYHQGAVWPWLIGPFVEAWLSLHDPTPDIFFQAASCFRTSFHHHLSNSGLRHISEICDGSSPHIAKGCPFQAWSLGEYLRVSKLLDESELRYNEEINKTRVTSQNPLQETPSA